MSKDLHINEITKLEEVPNNFLRKKRFIDGHLMSSGNLILL
jgi:hypothetical protein